MVVSATSVGMCESDKCCKALQGVSRLEKQVHQLSVVVQRNMGTSPCGVTHVSFLFNSLPWKHTRSLAWPFCYQKYSKGQQKWIQPPLKTGMSGLTMGQSCSRALDVGGHCHRSVVLGATGLQCLWQRNEVGRLPQHSSWRYGYFVTHGLLFE